MHYKYVLFESRVASLFVCLFVFVYSSAASDVEQKERTQKNKNNEQP